MGRRAEVGGSVRRGLAAVVVALGLVGALSPAVAGAAVLGPDRVSVSAPRGMSAAVAAATAQAAGDLHARSTVVWQGSIDFVGARRGATARPGPPAGMSISLSTKALDPGNARDLLGRDVGNALDRGLVVLGQTSARLRAAKVGDEMDVLASNGRRVSLTVGAVVADSRALWSELLVSFATARALGSTRPSEVLVWGFRRRASVDPALTRRLPTKERWEVSHSWDPADPDSVLSQAHEKALLGEFAMRRTRTGIVLDPAWERSHIQRSVVPIIGIVTCNRAVMPALKLALADVQAAGLARLINVRDTARNGGCYNPREVRTDSGTSGGNLSRHAWGGAVDINPAANPFGGRPSMDQRIVKIFHHRGFAWGGTWTIPDGMHFEYVGGPRG